jgi:hypothetical protein
MANYELWYCDPLGNRIKNIYNIKSFEYTKIVGDVGVGKFTVPIQGEIWEQVKPDYRIHVYRQAIGGSLELDFVCFLQGFEPNTKSNGSREYVLSGEGPNTLLKRRIVAYDTDDALSLHAHSSTGFAFRAVALRNLGASAISDRDITGDNFGIIGSSGMSGLGPAQRRSSAWAKILDILLDFQASSKNQGSEIFYDIIPISDRLLQFTIKGNQPGQDRSSTVFSLEKGNLVEPVLSYDYSNIASYVYVGGRGQGAARDLAEVEDTDRTGLSFWGRREVFRNATFVEQGDTDALNDIGEDELAKRRPQIKLTCGLIDTPSTRFGRDWDFGDKVTINYNGIQATTIVRAVNIKVESSGKETIKARAELEL